MADFGGYEQWLGSLQRQPAFLNNYWCAMLAYEMENSSEGVGSHTNGFKIPYSIVEEELIKEDMNINRNVEDAYISPALRHWLVHLLKAYDENVSILNVEDVLRSFIHNGISKPSGIDFPLSRSTLFHSLPSECKLWLFYMLRTYKKPIRTLPIVTKDILGNIYYIVSDCRLYVSIDRSANTTLPIDESRLNNQSWGPLYRFVHAQSCILLCENQEGWGVVWSAFQFYKLNELSYSVREKMTVKLSALHFNMMTRNKQRGEFEKTLSKLDSIPKAEIMESLSKNALKKQKKKIIDSNANNTNVNTLATDLKDMTLKNPNSPTFRAEVPPKKYSYDNEIMGKCWNFPQCPLKNRCKYVHPRNPCTKFPNCPRGWECLFLHEFCPNDAQCDEPNCPYEHVNSMTTYYRIKREPETAKPRPVASVAPVVREESTKSANTTPEVTSRPLPTPSRPANGPSQEERVRCQYYPKCTKVHTDKYFHPTEKCKFLAAGMQCAGRRCLFLHGTCPRDGTCEDWNCIYEHYKSPPVIERIMAAKKGAPQGSLSRTPSLGNISTCSRVSRGRRKSVTFDFDSDDDIANEKKDSSTQKPIGILKRPPVSNRESCRFRVRCTRMATCEYSHPREKCPVFPKCPNGLACVFLHEICKNDGVCSKETCDYEHYEHREIDNNWCKKGSLCKRIGCKFIHPQECTGRCPTPGNCWMYHRPGKAPEPARQAVPPPVPPRRTTSQPHAPNGPAPNTGRGFDNPGSPGNGAVPQFGGQPDPRYGYDRYPNWGHPQEGYGLYPGNPPGPGYGMGPGGYGPYPGYPQGPGYGYGPGMGFAPGFAPPGPGNYGRHPGHNPNSTARPTTPGASPPPPYPNLNRQEREFVEEKNRIYDERL